MKVITKQKLIHVAPPVSVLIAILINLSFVKPTPQENHPPVVKIVNPKSNSTFNWDTPVNYEVTVSDKEDGDSKFDEINPKEVLLEVRYFDSRVKQPSANSSLANNSPGLTIIRASNCFNCHEFNGKSIGPSFYDISKKYPINAKNIDSLTKHVKEGSSGIWGKEKMPTHTELTQAEVKSAVQWLLKNAATPNVNYYIGTTGTFKVKQPTAKDKSETCLLIASYIDHGLKTAPAKRLTGQDVVNIVMK